MQKNVLFGDKIQNANAAKGDAGWGKMKMTAVISLLRSQIVLEKLSPRRCQWP